MARDLGATLEALKHNLRTAKKFVVPWDQFHDEVAMVHIVSRIGEPADNPRLERCLAAIARQLLKCEDEEVSDPTFSYAQEHGFWHGSCWIGGYAAICFYFEDVGAGLVGFMGSPYDAEVVLARMNLVDLPAGANWNRMEGAAGCN